MLAVITFPETMERQILVEVGSVKSKGRNLDVPELLFGAVRQPRIARHREAKLDTTVHRDDDEPIAIRCRPGAVNQGTHATPS